MPSYSAMEKNEIVLFIAKCLKSDDKMSSEKTRYWKTSTTHSPLNAGAKI